MKELAGVLGLLLGFLLSVTLVVVVAVPMILAIFWYIGLICDLFGHN
ncbi:hypothetical protein KAR91_18055 [Candidatus Pacearchaeota archaeon]|nr:hypothetical protein [Candidatus Pacearchaeota archaeon]